MLSRVWMGLIVVFWVVMMATLVRLEFFPDPFPLDRCPTQPVLRRIFANPEPARLKVYYRGTYVGFCRIEIRPKVAGNLSPVLAPGQQPDHYDVSSFLNLTLSVFGVPSRLYLKGHSTFSPQFDLESFRMTTKINDGGVSIDGDDATRKVKVVVDLGDFHDERVFDFGQIQRAGFSGAFGMPGLANFSFPVDGEPPSPSLARSTGGDSRSRPSTVSYIDRLEVAGSTLRVFLIHSKVSDQIWTKIWVSETDGQVLKVSTSLGLEMVSDVLR
jgi:hypothetical protein